MDEAHPGADGASLAPLAPGVIVAGMHRSGTSLVTSVLAARGWHTPGELLAATRTQPRGYFEDMGLLDFHKDVLRAADSGWNLGPQLRRMRRDRSFSLVPHLAAAQDIVGRFRASGGPWSWKNPRATLFVDDWAELFPEAHIVFCVRAPAAVVDSLLRRGEGFGVYGSSVPARLQRLLRAISVWHSYNLMAYRFAKRRPERSTIVRIPEDLDQLAAATTPSLFEPALLQAGARREVELAAATALSSQWLLRRLRSMADPARLAILLQGPPGVDPSRPA